MKYNYYSRKLTAAGYGKALLAVYDGDKIVGNHEGTTKQLVKLALKLSAGLTAKVLDSSGVELFGFEKGVV